MSDRRGTPAYVQRIITAIAGVLTVFLTAVAFWLSFEHLHDVAADHGLSGVRAWAWPATLDTFIVIGEVLILRASIVQKVDAWAWCCAAAGSLGSITLNVVGVGADAGALDYTVAAVPPVAALFAFGILMRQLHQALASYMTKADPVDVIAGAFDVPRDLIMGDADGGPEPEYDASGLPVNDRPGDEETTGMDAGIGYLRGTPIDVSDAVVPGAWDEEMRARLASLPDASLSLDLTPYPVYADSVPARPTVAPVNGTPRPGHVPDRGHGDTAARGQTAVSRPVPGTGDTDAGDMGTGPGQSRTVPDSPGQRRTRAARTGLTQRVRDMLEINPGMTNEDVRDACPGDNPDSVKKSISRVRRELGETS
jgi:hypothetical protein